MIVTIRLYLDTGSRTLVALPRKWTSKMPSFSTRVSVPSHHLYLCVIFVFASAFRATADPFLLRGDASSTKAVLERQKQWVGIDEYGKAAQKDASWPQDVPQYRGEYGRKTHVL